MKIGMNVADSRATTHNGNYFARFATTPVTGGGADIVVTPRDGMVIVPEIDADTKEVRLRVRREVGPMPGRHVKLRGRMVEVAERRYDHEGNLQVRDAYTRTWEPWR